MKVNQHAYAYWTYLDAVLGSIMTPKTNKLQHAGISWDLQQRSRCIHYLQDIAQAQRRLSTRAFELPLRVTWYHMHSTPQ